MSLPRTPSSGASRGGGGSGGAGAAARGPAACSATRASGSSPCPSSSAAAADSTLGCFFLKTVLIFVRDSFAFAFCFLPPPVDPGGRPRFFFAGSASAALGAPRSICMALTASSGASPAPAGPPAGARSSCAAAAAGEICSCIGLRLQFLPQNLQVTMLISAILFIYFAPETAGATLFILDLCPAALGPPRGPPGPRHPPGLPGRAGKPDHALVVTCDRAFVWWLLQREVQ